MNLFTKKLNVMRIVLILIAMFISLHSYPQLFKSYVGKTISNEEYEATVNAFQKLAGNETIVVAELTITEGEFFLDRVTYSLINLTNTILLMRYPYKDPKEIDLISKICVTSYLHSLATCGVWIFNNEGENEYMTIDKLISFNEDKMDQDSWSKCVKGLMVNIEYWWNYFIYMNGILHKIDNGE